MEFSSKISKILEFSGNTVASLSRELSVGPGYIQDLKSGKSKNPKTEFLSLLVEKLFVNPRWLLTGEGPMFLEDESQTSKGLDVTAKEDSGFRDAVPDVYSLYLENQRLKDKGAAFRGCRVCQTMEKLNIPRQFKVEGFAEAQLSEQEAEHEAARKQDQAG